MSSFNRMLYRGLCRLMREFSNTRASNSEPATMVSKWSICATMARVFSVWPAWSWKYWLTRFFKALALPT